MVGNVSNTINNCHFSSFVRLYGFDNNYFKIIREPIWKSDSKNVSWEY
ncbi:Hypothetical protein I595_385 [Croceitalea dokdonensis DOKDO 023]|uniref:Uncharacterized protein n=1 Tax=Croceitalea dokdonensis DOKDO 023 TaxID=1300341 RepID=A0A0P7AZ10_9FLAO|nr:Hypothetical protein I595_385 [Croceitalea dokdonensis DOKDO 023]